MKKPSISNLPVKISFLVVILVTLLGLLSSLKGYRDFHSESREVERLAIEARKAELRKDVQRILALIHYQRSQAEERLKGILKSRIDEAFGMINHLYNRYRDQMSDEELQILIRESLRDIRFHEGRGYYFATRIRDGYEILCATCQHLENTILLDWRDEEGNAVIRNMIEIVTSRGEGFYTYYWSKPHEEGGFPKIAYVRRFEPFEWLIGTGEYLDTMEAEIKEEAIETIREIDIGKDKYIFVLDQEGRFLAHLDQGLIGQFLNDKQTVGGVESWNLFLEAAEKPSGDYVHYVWTDPFNEKAFEKLSYVAGVNDWQWVVGTGFLYKDILPGLALKREALRRGILWQIGFYAAILIGGIALVVLAGVYFKKKVRGDAETLVAFLGKAAQADRSEEDAVDVEAFHFKEFASAGEYSNWLIRERFLKEKALVENEAMLRGIFQAAPIGIGVTEDRTLRWCNDKCLEVIGYPMEHLRNRSTRLFYPDDEEYERVGRIKREQLEKGSVATVVTRWERKDGAILDVLLSWAINLPGDFSSGSVFTALDITERKAAEEALRQSEERYRTLIEVTLDGYFIFDLPEGRFLFLNRRICDVFGYSMEQGMGLTVWDVIAPGDHAKIREQIESFSAGGTLKYEPLLYEALRKDGATFRAEILTSAITYEGKQAVQGTLRDVTNRELVQAQLQQAQRIDAIGTLAGGIAHDFNNMLGIIMGHADLADLNLPDGSPERKNLGEIRRACLKAREMVKQILTFSRKGERDFRPISISPIVRESLTLLRASIPTTIEIRQSLPAGGGAVIGDATQINQVLINLCTNAAHAMRERGGVLEIRLEDVEVDEQTAARIHDLAVGAYVRLTIGDTGHGVSPDIMDRIFDPYFTTKGVGEGTGMGLAVVHGIVNAHGGAIAVESSPGSGTRFDVFFPRYRGSVEFEREAVEPVPGGHERILLVDDEEALLKIEKAMLSQLGYTVDAKKDSLEALDTFREQPALFDAVITDQTMPRMTGETLAREVLSLRSEIPVILCTGFSELISEEKAKAMGIREYMIKPLVMSELARTLRRVLDEAGR